LKLIHFALKTKGSWQISATAEFSVLHHFGTTKSLTVDMLTVALPYDLFIRHIHDTMRIRLSAVVQIFHAIRLFDIMDLNSMVHFIQTTMKDYKLSRVFKRACEDDVVKFCASSAKKYVAFVVQRLFWS
jgi:Cysteine rich repeat